MKAQVMPPCYGIIPARYESARFPGKPLVDILGKPMFWHVWSRASQCNALQKVILATDDQRIADMAESLQVPWVMTSEQHQSGTDRVYEAACTLGIPEDSVVVNIQGDEPALDPKMLDELVKPFSYPEVGVSTLAHRVSLAEASSPDKVKVVRAANGNALYFSRSLIPFARDGGTNIEYLGHIGLYAFRMKVLRRFTELPPSILEQTEKLEQLRLLENNIPIMVEVTAGFSQGVDKPEDLVTVIKILQDGSALI